VIMVSIVSVCCISWLNKVLNSVKKRKAVHRDQQPGDRGRTHGEYEAEGGFGSCTGG